tara:strand:- start:2925 stop:3116 length:192 start_codon:yes stop_codon:yes gene_type:complete
MEKKYVVLEYMDKEKYDKEMYNIYIHEKQTLKYTMKLNREEYQEFILDVKLKNIKLYTSLLSN